MLAAAAAGSDCCCPLSPLRGSDVKACVPWKSVCKVQVRSAAVRLSVCVACVSGPVWSNSGLAGRSICRQKSVGFKWKGKHLKTHGSPAMSCQFMGHFFVYRGPLGRQVSAGLSSRAPPLFPSLQGWPPWPGEGNSNSPGQGLKREGGRGEGKRGLDRGMDWRGTQRTDRRPGQSGRFPISRRGLLCVADAAISNCNQSPVTRSIAQLHSIQRGVKVHSQPTIFHMVFHTGTVNSPVNFPPC